jgi:large subunit ribosomal protein L22
MEVKAKTKYCRISPKKTRLVADLIRGLPVIEAENQLLYIPKKASRFILKTLKSAVANAEHNYNLKKENLYIKKITVDQGPTLKRWTAKAFGRATPIRSKTSHIEIVLEEIKPTEIKKKEKEPIVTQKLEKPIEIKEPVEVPLSSKEPVKKISEEEKPEIFDARRKGKRRTKQHLDKVKLKEKKGILKRIFRRKAI